MIHLVVAAFLLPHVCDACRIRLPICHGTTLELSLDTISVPVDVGAGEFVEEVVQRLPSLLLGELDLASDCRSITDLVGAQIHAVDWSSEVSAVPLRHRLNRETLVHVAVLRGDLWQGFDGFKSCITCLW